MRRERTRFREVTKNNPLKKRRPAFRLSTGTGRRERPDVRYAPSLVKTGRTGAEIELMRRSPDSVNDINNPANR